MALKPAPEPASAPAAREVVNDFSITVATINGTGSQTSNLTILRALFRMGIPVSGKNIFPSNIQGLPTWYTIRVNKHGFLARRDEHEIVIAMNPATVHDDMNKVVPGGVFLYADHIRPQGLREDVIAYSMPVNRLARESGAPPRLRDYVANMVYVGVLAYLLGIDLEAIRAALDFHFRGKAKAVELNDSVVRAAFRWAEEHLEKRDPYRVAPMEATQGLILSDGNTAAALGALFGGVQFVSWYPITPSTDLAETLEHYLRRYRVRPDGKHTFAVIQAEDELAAINMAIGAGWAGLRAMTATSGPGLSLMTEAIGLAYYAEVPVVVWDVQRVGPSTGLPTRTQQGDILFIHFASHGDTEHILLFPANINEAFEFGWRAFDIAERLQAPVFVMSDLDLGMNHWMGQPFAYPDQDMDRGKVLWEEDLERWEQEKGVPWGRYLDVDGDGIPYRTVMGNRRPGASYFTRGTGHDEYARYTEDPEVWHRMVHRIKKKYRLGRKYLPRPVEDGPGTEVGIIAYGTTDAAMPEARYLLEHKGIATDYLRIRALPFHDEVGDFLARHRAVYVVEANRDGQMAMLLRMHYPQWATRIHSVARTDGLPLTATFIADSIAGQEG